MASTQISIGVRSNCSEARRRASREAASPRLDRRTPADVKSRSAGALRVGPACRALRTHFHIITYLPHDRGGLADVSFAQSAAHGRSDRQEPVVQLMEIPVDTHVVNLQNDTLVVILNGEFYRVASGLQEHP